MNKQLNSQQAGFTLIELIMVIVILGVLAVTVLPRYVNLQGQANQSALDGVTGAMAAGSAINYAACVSGNLACLNAASTPKVASCADVVNTMTGGLPAGYTVTPTTAFVAAMGNTDTCTVTQTSSTLTATFSAINPG